MKHVDIWFVINIWIWICRYIWLQRILLDSTIQSLFFIFERTWLKLIGISTIITSLFWHHKTINDWRCLVDIETRRFIAILVSLLSFHFELFGFHLVSYFFKVIFIKLPEGSAILELVVFLYLSVCTHILILDFSHSHMDVRLLDVMLLIRYKLLFSNCLFGNFTRETIIGSMNIIYVWFIMFFQDTSRVLVAPLYLMTLCFSRFVKLFLNYW